MRAHGTLVLIAASAVAVLAGASLAGAPAGPAPSAASAAAGAAEAGPTCEAAARPEREAANLARIAAELERLERSREPGPNDVVSLDNRGYNYGEPLMPFPELPRYPQR
jgi:hypothetical protein